MHHDPCGLKAPRSVLRQVAAIAGGGGGADGAQRRKHGRCLASGADLARWAGYANLTLDSDVFAASRSLIGGGEHLVFYDGRGRVIKVTKPGFYGAQGGDAGWYLQRWAWHNEVFTDDVQVEGVVTLEGEDEARIFVSQPFQKGRDASMEEIAECLQAKGFCATAGGRWVHPVREIAVWDTWTPGNVLATASATRVIDLLVGPANREELESVRNHTGLGRAGVF